jgi:hypothetical protein
VYLFAEGKCKGLLLNLLSGPCDRSMEAAVCLVMIVSAEARGLWRTL